jgi:hypothetical protein
MNINPYSPTIPHYDSYEDFYKFFEVPQKDIKESIPIEVFPPVEPTQVKKQEITVEPKQDIR